MIVETFPMNVAGEQISNEYALLTQIEDGPLMSGEDAVRFLVIHCSATRCDRDYTVEQLLRDHKARGFRTIGYHFYIRKSGVVTQHRGIGICYEGGLDEQGNPADTRTLEQKSALSELLWKLHQVFPAALVLGHRDLPGVKKDCPCFDAAGEYRCLFHN